MKNKKFNYFTIVIYVLIIAALVVFVTSGNESVNKKPDELKTTDFYQLVREGFDLRPAAIIKTLDLRRPIYRQTAGYGHFGRAELDLPWEKTDMVQTLLAKA